MRPFQDQQDRVGTARHPPQGPAGLARRVRRRRARAADPGRHRAPAPGTRPEPAASRIEAYQPQQVPDLLQTREYARAVAAADPALPAGPRDLVLEAMLT